MVTLYVGNDMRLAFEDENRLKDSNGNAIPSASIEVTVYENDKQTEVSGVNWPLSFSDGDNNGEYYVILPSTMDIVAGDYYIIQIDVDTGSAKSMWRLRVEARYRD